MAWSKKQEGGNGYERHSVADENSDDVWQDVLDVHVWWHGCECCAAFPGFFRPLEEQIDTGAMERRLGQPQGGLFNSMF